MKQRSIPAMAVVAVLMSYGVSIACAATASLPPIHHDGAITYLSGGVGSDESAAIKNAEHHYPLTLEFVDKTHGGNDYLADVPVQISDAHNRPVLNADSKGPFMLVSLPQGRYTVTATYNGTPQHRTVNVADTAHAHEMFVWSM